MLDHLYVEPANRPRGIFETLPVVPASVPGFIKHVHCDGSREHVVSYECRLDALGRPSAVARCSTPNCIINHKG